MTDTPTYSELYQLIAAKQAQVARDFKAILDAALPQLSALAAELDEQTSPKSAVKNQLDAVVATMTSYSASVGFYVPAEPVDEAE